MALRIDMSPLDEYLLTLLDAGSHEFHKDAPHQIVIRDDGDRVFSIDPAAILRVIIRGRDLEDLDNEDADLDPLLADARGKLKGGKMAVRDKRFGYDDSFWDWWHRVGKKMLGRDLKTKSEADEWHNIYTNSQFLLRSSMFYGHISTLSFAEQKRAKHMLLQVAVRLCRNAL